MPAPIQMQFSSCCSVCIGSLPVEDGNSLLLWFLNAGSTALGCTITPTFPRAFPGAELQKREMFPAAPTPGRQVHHSLAGGGALQPVGNPGTENPQNPVHIGPDIKMNTGFDLRPWKRLPDKNVGL